MQADPADTTAPQRRAIGPAGTVARVLVGVTLVTVLLEGPIRPAAWLLGLVGLPAVAIAAQWTRARRDPTPLVATGPVALVANIAVLPALFRTPWYAPTLAATSNAAQLFYGVSMLVAAARGYAGCEVLAVSNWLLRRDDQIGCLLFEPVDRWECVKRQSVQSTPGPGDAAGRRKGRCAPWPDTCRCRRLK